MIHAPTQAMHAFPNVSTVLQVNQHRPHCVAGGRFIAQAPCGLIYESRHFVGRLLVQVPPLFRFPKENMLSCPGRVWRGGPSDGPPYLFHRVSVSMGHDMIFRVKRPQQIRRERHGREHRQEISGPAAHIDREDSQCFTQSVVRIPQPVERR